MTTWTDDEIPDQRGRTAFVTGATSGLGLQVARVLAARGARVLIGARDEQLGSHALSEVSAVAVDASPEVVRLDLRSLASVQDAAHQVENLTGGILPLLINNAGVMAPPLELSADGYESQWATNAIGHAALTWRLLPAIVAAPGSRVITVTSIGHYLGTFDPATIWPELRGTDYARIRTYNHTKLADLLFARELQRRLVAAGHRTLSVAAHPGLAESEIAGNLFKNGPEWMQRAAVALYNLPSQPTDRAAWSILFAATYPRMKGGYLIGPRGLALRGHPTAWPGSRASRDPDLAGRVWQLLQDATALPGAL
jgi:NAD(P)-dependent dehydrogenase (short-subunit alcohol dehydrogenase family)